MRPCYFLTGSLAPKATSQIEWQKVDQVPFEKSTIGRRLSNGIIIETRPTGAGRLQNELHFEEGPAAGRYLELLSC